MEKRKKKKVVIIEKEEGKIMEKQINKKLMYFLAFIIPVVIFFIGATLAGYLPFGKEIYQVFDARHQYPGFFIELINRINDGNIFYSFNGGLGFNFFGTLTYYLMSPLNIFVLLFNNKTLTIFFMIAIYLRIGLSGLTMAIYLNSQENSKRNWTIVFSTIFALCGFLSQYYYNFMWIDSIIMLPLIMMGIDKIFKGKRPIMFITCLSLGIIFNYYMGVILCIFSVIYFIYRYFTSEVKFLKVFKTFAISAVLVGLLSCFILIPTYHVLMEGKATIYGSDWIDYSGVTTNLGDFYYELTPASYKLGDQAYGPAMVYSSIFAYVLVILFFFNKKITKREKRAAFWILLFFYVSFSFNIFDYAWQLFQKPIWWQSRYAYTFSFFAIILAYKSITNLDGLKIKSFYKIIISLVMVALTLISFLNMLQSIDIELSRYFFLGFSLLLFIQIIYLIQEKGINWYFYVLIALELGLNAYNGLKITHYDNTYKYIVDNILINEKSLDFIKSYDKSFYRTELVYMNTNNDGMLNNYRGINFFNSTRNQQTMNFLEKTLGITVDSGCGVKLKTFLPDLMSFLNIKYLVGSLDYYKNVFENVDKSVYENTNSLSLGYMISNSYKNINLVDDKKEYNLEQIYSGFTNNTYYFYDQIDISNNISSLINVRKLEDVDGQYEVINDEEDGKIKIKYVSEKNYILFDSNGFSKYKNIEIDGKKITLNNAKYIYVKKDQTLVMTFEVDIITSASDFTIYRFDVDSYEQATKSLSSNLLNIKTNSNHLIEGTITATSDKKTMFTTIPYSEGFTIKVDGKVVKPIKIFNTFIGVELNPGQHNVIIDFIPQGLIPGSIISGTSLIGFITYIVISDKKRKKVVK